jgi:predicted RNA-binding protein associated with RNAse of E/G family
MEGADLPIATIGYHRQDRATRTFRQPVLHHDDRGIVTLLPAARVRAPVRIDGRAVLEPGAPVVWLTVPGAWFDVGRFHTRNGAFTGYYANVLSPPLFSGPLAWETQDLMLDVWLGAEGETRVLDEDAFEAAVARGAIDGESAARAREEAARIEAAARKGDWPPEALREWPLARALAAYRGADLRNDRRGRGVRA